MNIILKQFDTRYVDLNSELDAVTLDAEMRKFCDRSFWNFSINLSGKIKSDGRYSFSRRWQIGTTSNISSMPQLIAKIIPQTNGSLVEISMPVPFGSVFAAIAAFVICFFIMCLGLVQLNSGPFVLGLAFMLMCPAGIAYQNYWTRNKLLNTFVDTFGLFQL